MDRVTSADAPEPRPAARLGPALKTWRLLLRIKQSHAAELIGVSQATVSRWESAGQEPTGAQAERLGALMAARLDSASDRALAALVRHSESEVHLICDASHRLLAASPARTQGWRITAAELTGTSLWRYASAEIVQAEARLGEAGWFEPLAPAIELATGPNASDAVPIRPGRVRWTRMRLSDGSFARLVQAVAA
ncbi:helix-turn-helix transcriptional regulator [Phreatobacter stygius]|uniref:Helix-turn-helix transcriptional regulator n=2 Tax=Phreatobacter stygius TaxID=1940610 RepID=A0A4D7BNC0_9HYPH|nr:helix-turn-helix transcriptional regulator [Phreatobacter stygius]